MINKSTILILLNLYFFIGSQLCKAQCHIDDWTALKALYESTDGDNWTNNTNWDKIIYASNAANCSLSNVYGLHVNTAGRVIVVGLANNSLAGTITFEIEKLIDLRELILFGNNLTGSIPNEIGNLSDLVLLDLTNNQLSGSIPNEIGNLINLSELWLDENELIGGIPIELGNLINLTVLQLDDNKLSGSIPPELGNLYNLSGLTLRANQLNGSIPLKLGNLNNLTFLHLDNNKLSGSIPYELGDLSHLTELLLHVNQLSGNIPAELSNLSNLVALELDNNLFTGSISGKLGRLSNLKLLYLNENKLTGSIPEEFGNLSNLEELNLKDNNLSGCYPNNLSTLCSQLTVANFNGKSKRNNFNASWEDFCATGAGACESTQDSINVSTKYSGQVFITLNNNQNILKNKAATVYDYSTCFDYINISNCNPVSGFNNLAANEALWIITKASEYLFSHHNITIPSVNIMVNYTDAPNKAKYYPTHNIIILGKGDGIERNAMSAPDIVGHEYAHAVINHINYLGNYKIPGALNESYADILGELFEHYCKNGNNNWILGSDVMMNTVDNFKGLRNLSYPKDMTMKYQLPDTYKGVHWIDIDNTCFHIDYCGIHTNSGVHSYWFYLLANGGVGVNDKGNSYAINGIGIDKASTIIFNSLTNYLNPQSTFIDVRKSTIASAANIYANQPAILTTTIQAWEAVGVYEPIENPIEFRITNAIQTGEEYLENNKTLITVQFDLNIDSLGMDISADGLCFSLHLPPSYNNAALNTIYEPLNRIELTDTITNGEIQICINRTNAGTTKQGVLYPKIASKSAIIQFVVPIVVENLKGEISVIESMDISGYSKNGFGEAIDFKPATLPFGFDYNTYGGIEPPSPDMFTISLTLAHKNCNHLGSLNIEVSNNNLNDESSYTYILRDIYGYLIEEIEINNTTCQFFNLEEGTYKVTVKNDNHEQLSKQFSIGFVSEAGSSQCCANNLIIPPGSVNGKFNANNDISFSKGVLIFEGDFEICE